RPAGPEAAPRCAPPLPGVGVTLAATAARELVRVGRGAAGKGGLPPRRARPAVGAAAGIRGRTPLIAEIAGPVAAVATGVESRSTGAQATAGRCVNREACMNRKIVGIGVGMAIMLAASTAVRAQNSPAGAGIDAALRGAVERKDVPGVVALVTDRRRVLYQG